MNALASIADAHGPPDTAYFDPRSVKIFSSTRTCFIIPTCPKPPLVTIERTRDSAHPLSTLTYIWRGGAWQGPD